MAALDDILKKNNGKLPEDKLMAYLEGRLPADEQHEIELWMAQDGMEADALEGLNALPAQETKQLVDSLNYKLRKELGTKKRKHEAIKTNLWSWLAIIVILLLCIVAYVVIYTVLKKL